MLGLGPPELLLILLIVLLVFGAKKICGNAAGRFNATHERPEPLLAQLSLADQKNRPDGGLLHTVGRTH